MLDRRCPDATYQPGVSAEFKADAVRLAQSGDKSIATIAHDLGVADQTLRSWVQQAEYDAGTRDGLTTTEPRSCGVCAARTASSRRNGRS